jgi:hypothetical protein
MVNATRSIHIDAPVEQVFRLMADPFRRAALNPEVEPIQAEVEGGGPLRKGSVCHYRLQTSNRIIDYRMRVIAFESNHLIESQSNSEVPFQVRIETTPDEDGSRLSQSEQFEPTEELLDEVDPQSAFTRLVYGFYLLFDVDAAMRLRERREALLEDQLGRRLEAWLGSVRAYFDRDGHQV